MNPTYAQANESDLDIVVAGTEESVIMVEAGCRFVPEQKILDAVAFAMGEIKKQVQAQKEFADQCGAANRNMLTRLIQVNLKIWYQKPAVIRFTKLTTSSTGKPEEVSLMKPKNSSRKK